MSTGTGDGASDRRGGLALVLGGGGSKGALQAGLYRALCELGLRPDLIVGTSVGALNGALIAAGVGPRTLARGWTRLSRADLFRFSWPLLWKGLRAESLFSGSHFRRFLENRLPERDLRHLEVPLHVVSTHLSTGEACRWDEGPVVDAVQASCAVPGLLPPVYAHGGVAHVDGSLGNNLPVRVAREAGASRIVAVRCQTCARCDPTRFSLSEVIGRAFSIAADCSVRDLPARARDDPDILLVRFDLGERIYALDFSHGERLVEAGYRRSLPRLEAWLDGRSRRPAPSPA